MYSCISPTPFILLWKCTERSFNVIPGQCTWCTCICMCIYISSLAVSLLFIPPLGECFISAQIIILIRRQAAMGKKRLYPLQWQPNQAKATFNYSNDTLGILVFSKINNYINNTDTVRMQPWKKERKGPNMKDPACLSHNAGDRPNRQIMENCHITKYSKDIVQLIMISAK